MNSRQLPATIDSADIGNRVQDYFAKLEQQSADLQRECELLRTQNRDLEKNLHAAEDRAERAEKERDQARAQRDDALEKSIAAATYWGTILHAALQGEALFKQTANALKQAIGGAPSRNGPNKPRPLAEIESGIAQIAKSFNDQDHGA